MNGNDTRIVFQHEDHWVKFNKDLCINLTIVFLSLSGSAAKEKGEYVVSA